MALEASTERRLTAPYDDEGAARRPPALDRGAGLRRDLVWLALTLGTTLAGCGVVLRLWRLRLGVPMGYAGDTKLSLATVQTVLEKGWYLHTDRLGAPLGQRLYDYPFPGDTLHLAEFKLLGLFSHDAAVVVNLFYLLSFALIAATAFMVLRALRVVRPLAAALAVLYACLPFHFLRGESHLFLSNYWIVPLACWVILRQLGDDPLLDLSRQRLATERIGILHHRGTLAAVGICVAAGLTGIYYAAVTALWLAVTGLARSLRLRRPAPFLTALLLAGIVIGTVVASVLPSLLYLRSHGHNEAVAQRAYFETEFYGLKVVNLVLPLAGHRVDALAQFRHNAADTPVPGEGSETLGLVGTAGFLGLLLLAFSQLTGARPSPRSGETAVAGHLAIVAIISVLFGAVAGFSGVLASIGFTSLRGWNRISVFIAFLSLAAVGLAGSRVFGAVAARQTDHPRGRALQAVGLGLAGLLAVLGVWDQTNPAMTPDHRALAAAWDGDRAFVRQVEEALGAGAEVFQLPFAPFPEIPPIADMADYEHVRGYLHSKTLRWSYGAMKGRPESEWQAAVVTTPTPELVESLALVGFDGIWIDRLGFPDRAYDLVAQVQSALGAGPRLTSPDDRFVVFDLAGMQRSVQAAAAAEQVARARQAILHPFALSWSTGFYQQEQSGLDLWRWAGPSASLALTNPTKETRMARLRMALGGARGTSHVEVRWPGGSQIIEVNDRQRHDVDVQIPLHPGRTQIRLVSDAPAGLLPGDTRDLRFRVFDASALDVARDAVRLAATPR